MSLVSRSIAFVVAVMLFVISGDVGAQVEHRLSHIEKKLAESRQLSPSDPAKSARLRDEARREYDQLRADVMDARDALDSHTATLEAGISDADWGEFWAYMEAGAHAAVSVDKGLDAGVRAVGADRNPQINSILKLKEKIHYGISVYNDVEAGDYDKAAARVASRHTGVEGKVLSRGYLGAHEFPDSPTDAAQESLKGANDWLKASDSSPGVQKSIQVVNDAVDAGQALGKASQALDNANAFDAFGAKLDRELQKLPSQQKHWRARDRDLDSFENSNPELQGGNRFNSSSDVQYVREILIGYGSGINDLNSLAPRNSVRESLTADDLARVEKAQAYLQARLVEYEQEGMRVRSEIQAADDRFFYEYDGIQEARMRRQIAEIQEELLRLESLKDPAMSNPDNGSETDDLSTVEYCPNGALECPNGVAWPDCMHLQEDECPRPDGYLCSKWACQ